MNGLDVGVDKLRSFCDLLEATNPAVATGAAELDAVAHQLEERLTGMSSALADLDHETDALEHEAADTEREAVAACTDLAQEADDTIKTDLPGLATEIGESNALASKVLDERTSALEAGLQELAGQGWTLLHTAVAAERHEFEKWTGEAGTAMDTASHAAEAAATDLEHDSHELGTQMGAWHVDIDWSPAVTEAQKVEQELVHTFGSEVAQVSQGLSQSYEQLARSMAQEAEGIKTSITDTAGKAAQVIDAAAAKSTQGVENAASEVDGARVELEAAAVRAGEAEGHAGALADLARHIETADGQLDQIRAAMEAMGS